MDNVLAAERAKREKLEPVESRKQLLRDRKNGKIPFAKKKKLHEKKNAASRKLPARRKDSELKEKLSAPRRKLKSMQEKLHEWSSSVSLRTRRPSERPRQQQQQLQACLLLQ